MFHLHDWIRREMRQPRTPKRRYAAGGAVRFK